ncbi:hypothetical protein ACF063_30770 [Streptomyces chartreusis]
MSEPTALVAGRDTTHAHQSDPVTPTATSHTPLATPATPTPAPKKAQP